MCIRDRCKSIMSCLFTLDEGLKNVRVVKDGEKTVYIMLYDSEMEPNQDYNLTISSRYMNDKGSEYPVSYTHLECVILSIIKLIALFLVKHRLMD